MQQQQPKYPIKRKQLSFKPISSKLPKRRKLNNFLSPVQQNLSQDDKKFFPQKQAQKNIGQNISLIAKIQQGSFISNKQDQSLDSFDKMIIGVDEELDIQDQNTSNSKENDINYTLLYRQFERLIKHEKLQKNDSSEMEIEEQSKILREDLFPPQEEKSKDPSFQLHVSSISNLKLLRQKFQQIKDIRRQRTVNQSTGSDQNISLRLLGANLSQIHQQEIQHNTSLNRMDAIEEQFIDFVSKNQSNKINISKIEKNSAKEQKKLNKANRQQLNNSIKEPEEDEVVAMLQNQLGSHRENLIQEQQSLLEEQSQMTKKKDKQFFQKENYHQILRELDENQDKKLDISQSNSMLLILSKREQWINSGTDRSSKWKTKELTRIQKIKEIFSNPYVEFSDESNQES